MRLTDGLYVVEGTVGSAGFAHWSVYSTNDPDTTPTNEAWEHTLRELADQRVRVTFEVSED